MTSRARLQLKNKLKDIEEHEGRGTELVSLILSPDDNIQERIARLSTEEAEADNIKSDQTSKNVKKAVGKASRLLKGYDNIPQNGLVIYAGVTTDSGMVSYVLDDLPTELTHSEYFCGSKFKTEPLYKLIRPDNSYGLIVVTRDKGAIGQVSGNTVTTIREIESQVMGKSKAGGQSQARMERIREEQRHNHYQKVAAAARDEFLDEAEENLLVEGCVVGGTNGTVDTFINGEYLHYKIDESLLGTFNVNVGDQTGVRNLADKASEAIGKNEISEAKEYVEKFFKGLSSDEINVAYGEEEINKAFDYGAIETLLVSETIDEEKIDEYEKQLLEIGAELEVIPISFELAERFNNPNSFGGVGAILRYPIN